MCRFCLSFHKDRISSDEFELLPTLGATTQGETLPEAREMAKDLIQGHLEALLKMGRPIPQETRRLKDGEPVTVTLTVAVA